MPGYNVSLAAGSIKHYKAASFYISLYSTPFLLSWIVDKG